ncbi:MAG: DUF4404 family protein [Planctomycetota bacterium]
MQRDDLLESLGQLHSELSRLDETDAKIDPQTRAALAKVDEDLQRLLDPDDETTADDVESSSEGVRGYLMEFEAEHPRLAEAIGRIADGLANLGI